MYQTLILVLSSPSTTTQEAVVTYLPITVSLLAAWLLVRRRHVTLGLLAPLIIPPLLWLAADLWLVPHPECAVISCSLGHFLGRLFNGHYFFMLFVLPIGLSLVPTQFLIRRRDTRLAVAPGALTLIVFWTAMQWVLIDTCNRCRVQEPTCCELEVFGFAYNAILALAEILVVGLIAVAIRHGVLRKRRSQENQTQDA